MASTVGSDGRSLTNKQRCERLLKRRPDLALELGLWLMGEIRGAQWRKLEVQPESRHADAPPVLICPHCRAQLTGSMLQVTEWGTVATRSAEIRPAAGYHRIFYEGTPDLETLYYTATCCNTPVGLPDGWDERSW